jgi:hypothetical protein
MHLGWQTPCSGSRTGFVRQSHVEKQNDHPFAVRAIKNKQRTLRELLTRHHPPAIPESMR